ncbi:acetyl esterase/lipase [Actinoplanes octamycinicus]|uniref:Acetyl esterase/lipase n=1 Tax=Actinoplanes octamycinicus TaxID=135948 RepID=A0A7W7H187_9ACTN|nr:alpha/beta hydrolase [Actinoplanes octamycinicus]MBB4742131.1 acetyl esterase/lipase [Actinoplanes octamycinicus]GIE60023.1 esterase [Actinoplanes octamycinicus]
MSGRDRVDPEARAALDARLAAVPGGFQAIGDIVARRAAIEEMTSTSQAPPNPRIHSQDHTIPATPEVLVRVYRPAGTSETLPGIYCIHGGGMVQGNIDGDRATASLLCEQINAVVVSVRYRLAPEHPYPAAVEDCYTGLTWMVDNAAELGLDPRRVAVYGASAGGGLTIATALLARDRGGPPISFMMPIYPMIDDRHETASSREITDLGSWDRDTSIQAWTWYLGGRPADGYAAPARAEDLTGLPPAFIDVGTVDLFRDEDITFAQRLMAAGVPTELHVHPGSYHGAESLAPDSALARRTWQLRLDALRRALA